MKVKVDLHVHTCYSYDGLIKPQELVFYAKKAGLNGVAITDHDRVDAALKMVKKVKDFLIIPGTEVSSLNGHIIGLNLQETVPKNLSVEETVDKIHELGGLAVACHPKAVLKASLGQKTSRKFDAVEVINASAFPFKRSIEKAREIANKLGLPQVAGSDAHYAPEIGTAYTIVETEFDCDGVAKAIKNGLCEPFGKPTPLSLKLKREILNLKLKMFPAKSDSCSNNDGFCNLPQCCDS
ncbi:MAG: CehA/McbA family metallohydrolase [Candidatus Bathyarchaeota archaeon]|nr:CehA/McbA family metallohydrolase [Candidatus Bathyarchaeota archaeon]MDW8040946.1 CehA/McbA family metallohydrolase [Nitrososphaerota archaeon]